MKKPKRKELYAIMSVMALVILVLFICLLLSGCSETAPQPVNTSNAKYWEFKSANVSALFKTEGETGSMTVVSGTFTIKGTQYIIGKKIAITKDEIRLEDAGLNLVVFDYPIFNGSQAYITCDGYVYDGEDTKVIYVPGIILLTRKL